MLESHVNPSFNPPKNLVQSLRKLVLRDHPMDVALKLLRLIRQSCNGHIDGIDSGFKRFQTSGVPSDMTDHAKAAEQSESDANHNQRGFSRCSQGIGQQAQL